MHNHNIFDFEKYRILKEETALGYQKIVSVFCPALKSKVIFNAKGLHHLRYDFSGAERPKKSQYIKFLYLPKAVEIIKTSTTIQEYRRGICPVDHPDKNGYKRTSSIEWFGMFAIISFSKKIRLRTVIRRIGAEDGLYHFWSVIPFWTLSNNQRIIGEKQIENE